MRGDETSPPPILTASEKADRLFVDRQDDAARLAGDAVAGAWRVDPQGAGFEGAVGVALATGEHEDVFVSFMQMKRHGRGFMESNQCRRGAGLAITVKPVDFHAFPEGLPRNGFGMLPEPEKIPQFQVRKGLVAGLRIGHGRIMDGIVV